MMYIERTNVMAEIESIPKTEAKRLLRHFDIVDTEPRSRVRHYPVQVKGVNEFEFVKNQLQSMEDAAWYAVMNELNKAFDMVTRDKNEMFQLLTSNAKIGRILVAQPHTFSHIGKPLNELKTFAFTRIDDDGEVIINAEINFTVELY